MFLAFILVDLLNGYRTLSIPCLWIALYICHIKKQNPA